MSSRPFSHDARRQELITATRKLFDDQGAQVAGIEQIARQAGITRALIYRSFVSKDDLFVRTTAEYLAELAVVIDAAIGAGTTAEQRLRACLLAYSEYCLAYPAFLDCQFSLMQQPASQLRTNVTGDTWAHLGDRLSACLAPLARVLADGTQEGLFAVKDPATSATLLWSQMLGVLHLVRIGVAVGEGPRLFRLSAQQVIAEGVDNAVRAVHVDTRSTAW